MHLKCTFIKAQLFLPSYCGFIVLGTSSVSIQLGGFLCHFITEDGWLVSPFWNEHQLDFMSYLQCIKTVCVQHVSSRTQRFCCLFIFLMWQREKKDYKNNNRGEREHEKQSGFKVSSLNKVTSIAVKNTASICVFISKKKLFTFNWSTAKQTQSVQNHKFKQLFSDLLCCKNIFVWEKEKFQNKKDHSCKSAV